MSTLLNKNYLVKVSTKGGGGSKMPQILSTWFVHNPIPDTALAIKKTRENKPANSFQNWNMRMVPKF